MHRLPLHHCHHLRLPLESTNTARRKRKYACRVTQQSKTVLELRDTETILFTFHKIKSTKYKQYNTCPCYILLEFSVSAVDYRLQRSQTLSPFFLPKRPTRPWAVLRSTMQSQKISQHAKGKNDRATKRKIPLAKHGDKKKELKKPIAVGWPIVRYLSGRLGCI